MRGRCFDVQQIHVPEVERVFLAIAHAARHTARTSLTLRTAVPCRQIGRERRIDRDDVLLDVDDAVLPSV